MPIDPPAIDHVSFSLSLSTFNINAISMEAFCDVSTSNDMIARATKRKLDQLIVCNIRNLGKRNKMTVHTPVSRAA